MFKDFLIIFTIIIIHELGHYLMASIFKWNIEKIEIYPFGGCVKFNEKLNKPMYQELLILIMGPLFQIILFLLVELLFNVNLVSFRNYTLFKNYHYTLLSFNLLPIYPLDGGKLFNLICNYFLPFKKGNKLAIILSYLFIVIMFINYKAFNFFLVSVFLLTEITIYLKKQPFLYNRLLLERYLDSFSFSKLKIINNKNNMYKGKRHLIKIKDKYYTEKEYLKKRFKENL